MQLIRLLHSISKWDIKHWQSKWHTWMKLWEAEVQPLIRSPNLRTSAAASDAHFLLVLIPTSYLHTE